MRWLANAEISTTSMTAGTSPSPRTVSPKTTGAARMRTSPRHGIASAARGRVAEPVCKDDEPKGYEESCEDQRKVAGTHAQRRADLEPDRAQPEQEADCDEDQTGADVPDVDSHRHTPAGRLLPGLRRMSSRLSPRGYPCDADHSA